MPGLTSLALWLGLQLASGVPVQAQEADDFDIIEAGSLPLTIPFEVVMGHPVVDIAIGDHEPKPFLLDTGAPTYVSAAIAEAHARDVLGAGQTLAGGGRVATDQVVVLDSPMSVGPGIEITRATAYTPWISTGSFSCVTADGLLGSSALSDAVWQIDYGAGEITAAASVDQIDHIEDAIRVPFVPRAGLSPTPVVSLQVGGGVLEFLVDTGAAVGIVIDSAALDSVGVKVPATAPTIATLAAGAGGAFEATLSFVEVPITFGTHEIPYVVARADGFAPGAQGTIGHQFLKSFVTTFDWSSSTIYLDPIAADGSLARLMEPAAAGISWDGHQIVVGSVPRGGPADRSGLSVGQVVASLDGESVEGATIDEFCEIATGEPPESVTTDDGRAYDAGRIAGFFDDASE